MGKSLNERTVWQGALLLLTVTLLVPAAQGAAVDGFVEAAPPVQLNGSLSSTTLDPSLLLQNPDLGTPATPIVFSAREIHITHELLETETFAATLQDLELSFDGPQTQRESTPLTAENVTIEISVIGPDADIVFGGSPANAFGVTVQSPNDQAMLTVEENVTVVDGYRKTFGPRTEGFTQDYEYTYHHEGPLVNATGLDHLFLRGGAEGYIWDAHVRVRNASGVLATFETGHTSQEDLNGAHRTDRYEYITFQADGLAAELEPGGLRASLYAPGMRLGVDGTVDMPLAEGTFNAGEEVYRAGEAGGLSLAGNLSLAFTPTTGSDQSPRFSIGLGGHSEDLNLAPLPSTSSPFLDATVVSAGSATVLGLAAAWYVLSLKGASAAALLARPKREEEQETDASEAAVKVERPGDLLMDTDRFTLYHLVKAQVGLSAEECQRRTGIEDARAQLETLAQHNLLVPMAEDPRRYCLPGMVQEDRARRIAMLRDEQAFQVASVLAIHGLMPVGMLLERASKAHPGLDPGTTRRTLERLLHRGLAMREEGREGPVVDATPELYECLKLMGERALVPDF